MNSKRVCIFTANRSEYSRLVTVMEAIKAHPGLVLQVVVSGSHLLSRYGQTVLDIEKDGFDIFERVHVTFEGASPETMAKSAGLAIIELTTCFKRIRPDILLVVGDRYDMFPAVVTASYLNIPVAHIQGGEQTGTIDESIRHAATKFAHIHFPASPQSKEFIIQMGEDPKRVFLTGCPSIDVLLRTEKIERQKLFKIPPIPSRDGKRSPRYDQDYLILIQHPVTTEFGESYEQMQNTLKAIHELQIQTIMIYPNLDAGTEEMITALRRFKLSHNPAYLFCYKHMPMHVFVNLLRHAACIVGNSSAGIRESCYFGTPSVNIGTRQKNRTRGSNVLDIGHDPDEILRAIKDQLSHGRYPVEHIYGSGDAGKSIADLLFTQEITVQK